MISLWCDLIGGRMTMCPSEPNPTAKKYLPTEKNLPKPLIYLKKFLTFAPSILQGMALHILSRRLLRYVLAL